VKAVPEHAHLYCRGKGDIYYLRRRIPTAIRAAYPNGRNEIIRSLRTRGVKVAKKLLRSALVSTDREFAVKEAALREHSNVRAVQRVSQLSAEQLRDFAGRGLAPYLKRTTKLDGRGLDEAEFAELGARIASQQEELGQMLARGNTRAILPAMYGYLRLCGLDARLNEAEEQRAGYAFLQSAVRR
jgi:hypothetical protein